MEKTLEVNIMKHEGNKSVVFLFQLLPKIDMIFIMQLYDKHFLTHISLCFMIVYDLYRVPTLKRIIGPIKAVSVLTDCTLPSMTFTSPLLFMLLSPPLSIIYMHCRPHICALTC